MNIHYDSHYKQYRVGWVNVAEYRTFHIWLFVNILGEHPPSLRWFWEWAHETELNLTETYYLLGADNLLSRVYLDRLFQKMIPSHPVKPLFFATPLLPLTHVECYWMLPALLEFLETAVDLEPVHGRQLTELIQAVTGVTEFPDRTLYVHRP